VLVAKKAVVSFCGSIPIASFISQPPKRLAINVLIYLIKKTLAKKEKSIYQ
jgi:hypothetical protein